VKAAVGGSVNLLEKWRAEIKLGYRFVFSQDKVMVSPENYNSFTAGFYLVWGDFKGKDSKKS
jgi:hypothetical protein